MGRRVGTAERHHTSLLRRTLAWVPGIALGLFLCEVILRLSGIGDPAATVGHRMEENRARAGPTRGAYVPDSRLVYHYANDPFGTVGPAGTITGSINAHGYRGADRPPEKPDGTWRIAALGDSFTLGYGVRDDETWPAQLERELGVPAGASPGVEVLNFGVSDADTRAEVNYLEGYALSFQPDLVLIALFLNDAGREATMTYLDPRKAPLRRLRRYSFLANLALSEFHRRRVGGRLVEHYRAGYEEGSPGWQDVRAELRRARDLCRSRGIDFALLIYPILYRLENDYPFAGIHGTIADFARAEGIRCIDLLPALAGRSERELMVHPADPHPNAQAHGLVARHLAGELGHHPLVPLPLTFQHDLSLIAGLHDSPGPPSKPDITEVSGTVRCWGGSGRTIVLPSVPRHTSFPR